MSAFLCLGCADSGHGCPTCTPAEARALLTSIGLILAGLAIVALSCRGGWRWWL